MSAVFTDEGVKLVWLTALPTNPAALTAVLLNGGKDLSDFAVVGECEFIQTDPDTIDQKVYSDKGKVSVPTYDNANGRGTFYRDRDGTGVPTVNDVLSLFNNRQVGYIIKRKGVPESVAWAVGQDYEFFKFQAMRVGTIGDADGGYERIEVGFAFKGDTGFGAVTA